MKRSKRTYIYTDKKHSEKGIFSTVLAVLSFAFLILTIVSSYYKGGDVGGNVGAVVFVCTLFSAIGIIIGSLGRREKEKFVLFANIGIVWNVINLFMVSGILYAGI